MHHLKEEIDALHSDLEKQKTQGRSEEEIDLIEKLQRELEEANSSVIEMGNELNDKENTIENLNCK